MSEYINQDLLIDFLFDKVSEGQRKIIIKKIETNEIIRGVYLKEKRKFDIEKYLNNEMSFSEKIELEELLRNDPGLRKHFNLSKDVNRFLKFIVREEQHPKELEKLNIAPHMKCNI